MFLYDEFTAANVIFIVYEMNAPQNQQPTVIDSMDGTLTEWYNACDEAFRLSEVIPGQYEYTISTSYGTQCPVSEGGMTNIDVSCERFYCISLDNSYIYVEQTIPVTLPNLANAGYTGSPSFVYAGYKSAFDALDQYRIYSNGDLVQTQNNANFESFILYNLLSDQAKENSTTTDPHPHRGGCTPSWLRSEWMMGSNRRRNGGESYRMRRSLRRKVTR